MKAAFGLRKIHKWLGLIVGLQMLIWGFTGLYMTVINIDIIHGDHLVQKLPPKTLNQSKVKPMPSAILAKYHPIYSIDLISYNERSVYQIKNSVGVYLLSTDTLKPILKADPITIKKLATKYYAGKAKIKSIKLMNKPPREVGLVKDAVWQVMFDDWLSSTLYFSAQSTRLIKKRTDLWRIFDVMWMLHIMDYAEREKIDTWFFRLISFLAIVFSLSGLILLFYTLKKTTKPSQKLLSDVGVN